MSSLTIYLISVVACFSVCGFLFLCVGNKAGQIRNVKEFLQNVTWLELLILTGVSLCPVMNTVAVGLVVALFVCYAIADFLTTNLNRPIIKKEQQ